MPSRIWINLICGRPCGVVCRNDIHCLPISALAVGVEPGVDAGAPARQGQDITAENCEAGLDRHRWNVRGYAPGSAVVVAENLAVRHKWGQTKDAHQPPVFHAANGRFAGTLGPFQSTIMSGDHGTDSPGKPVRRFRHQQRETLVAGEFPVDGGEILAVPAACGLPVEDKTRRA